MSKKYIIEIEDEPLVRKSALHGETAVYKAKGFNSLVFDAEGLKRLEPYEEQRTYKVAKPQEMLTVGDEVIFGENDDYFKAVVLDEADEPDVWFVLTENGCVEAFDKRLLEKTGRHYSQISAIIKRMRNDE